MLLGTTAAGLAFALSGRSYEVTFALSAVASLMALLLVVTALGKDATAGAAERGGRGRAEGNRGVATLVWCVAAVVRAAVVWCLAVHHLGSQPYPE